MVSFQDIRNLMQDYSLPLLLGILVAIVFANVSYEDYNYAFGKKGSWEPGHLSIFGHHVTISFLVNDIFMCFFFGLAAKEVRTTMPRRLAHFSRRAVIHALISGDVA